MSKQEKMVAFGLLVADTLMLMAALAAAFAWRYGGRFMNDPAGQPTTETIVFAVVLLVTILALFAANRLYDPEMLFSGHREYAAVMRAVSYGAAVVLVLAFLADQPISRGALVLSWLFAIPAVGGSRFLIRRAVFRLRESGRFVRRWLIVGTGAHAVAVARQLNWPASGGVHVAGFLDDFRPVGSHVVDGLCVLGDPRAVREVAKEYDVSTLVILPNAISWESYRDLLEMASGPDGLRLKLAPGLQDLVTTGAEMTDSGFLPLISLQPLRIRGMDALLKRGLDYVCSLPLLALLAPCAALCWLAARIDRRGPLFARQPVLGQQRERFAIIMFAEPAAPCPLPWLSRLAWQWRRMVSESRFGKLPNVLNVLAGHMSLVGPRAVAASNARLDEPRLHNLLRVRPGLTGPAADATQGEGPEEQALRDIGYVREYSILLDLRLMSASFKRVLRRQRSLPSSYKLTPRKRRTSPATPSVVERVP